MTLSTLQAAPRPRAFVAVSGPEAAAFLERMVSNEVVTLPVGDAREALLLTAKARIVATMTIWRRDADDFLLATEPAAGDALRSTLLRARFAAKCVIEPEAHRSTVVVGEGAGELLADGHTQGWRTADFGVEAVELLDGQVDAGPLAQEELERLRILARTPRLGAELDDRVLPAEAGLEDRAISFTKGCYPGQEPVARLHYRGHPNRGLRVLALDPPVPAYDAELALDGKVVGRITSWAPDPDHGVVCLAYVRREVPDDAVLSYAGRPARQLA